MLTRSVPRGPGIFQAAEGAIWMESILSRGAKIYNRTTLILQYWGTDKAQKLEKPQAFQQSWIREPGHGVSQGERWGGSNDTRVVRRDQIIESPVWNAQKCKIYTAGDESHWRVVSKEVIPLFFWKEHLQYTCSAMNGWKGWMRKRTGAKGEKGYQDSLG